MDKIEKKGILEDMTSNIKDPICTGVEGAKLFMKCGIPEMPSLDFLDFLPLSEGQKQAGKDLACNVLDSISDNVGCDE